MPALHGVVKPALRLGSPSPNHGAGEVAVIPGREVAGKDVEDDELVGTQGAVSTLVRVASLDSPGHDRVRGFKTAPRSLHPHLALDPLRGEWGPTQPEPSVSAGAGAADEVCGEFNEGRCDAERRAHLAHLRHGLDFTLRKKPSLARNHPDSQATERLRHAERKVGPDRGATNPVALERRRTNLGHPRRTPEALAERPRDLGEADHLIGMRLATRTVVLQLTDNDAPPSLRLKPKKWIGREKPRRVKHIRVAFARGVNEAVHRFRGWRSMGRGSAVQR